LVGASAEDLVLDCYWLAQWYHQNPEVFLAMPLSQMQLHMARSQQIFRMRAAAQAAAADDGY
jgi:hypothetical protein